MLKSIQCDPFWQENEIKIYIKKTIGVTLNNVREQRIFSLGEDTIFKDIAPNKFQITAGNLFNGTIMIEKEQSESIFVEINFDDAVSINKSLWEGLIKIIEKQLTQPLD